MIVDTDNVMAILGRLSTAPEKERTTIIESVRPVLGSGEERLKYKSSIENSDLTILFDCLNASGKSEIVTASDILDQILSFIDASLVLSRYLACLNRCLHHPQSEVKIMVIKFLRRCIKDEQCLGQVLNSGSLIVDVTKAITDEDNMVAKEVKLFIYEMASLRGSEEINSLPFIQPILPILQELSNQEKEVNRLRIEELMIMIAKLSAEMTERVANAGFLQRICQEVLTDDVLVQLNALEILSDFAESNHGILYLEQKGALKDMDNLLGQSCSSPMASYLLPGFIKFFGRVSRNLPTNFVENYPNFTNTVLSLIANDTDINNEPGMKNLAIATIGHISTSIKGKQKIAEIDGFLNDKENGKIMKVLVNGLRYGATNDKVVALTACGDILSSTEQNECLSSEINLKFYQGLVKAGLKNPMEHIFEIIKQPFAELAQASYTVMQNIARETWGVSLFTREPGMLEYFLDRNVAMKKEGKEMKYEVIRILQENSASLDDNIMPPEMLMRLKRYTREGPFHVEAQAEVALGEG